MAVKLQVRIKAGMVIESVDDELFALCAAVAARAIDRSSSFVSMPSLPVPHAFPA
jgi:hypothetical protein